jgi:hypothetical protein
MPLLRMRDATFASGTTFVGPVSLELSPGEHTALQCSSEAEAAIVALLATGIVKASSGCVLIDDYDPHVQSVHCKRIAGLVPHEPFLLDDGEFARYILYRAALWSIDPRRAQTHAALLRRRLAGMHESFAYPLIATLIGMPRLVVLDRPQPAYARLILEVIGRRGLLSTHTDAAAAHAFCPSGAARLKATQA